MPMRPRYGQVVEYLALNTDPEFVEGILADVVGFIYGVDAHDVAADVRERARKYRERVQRA